MSQDLPFLSRRIHLVTGKGGVGRTTLAAALAAAAARHGKRVLLTEIGDPEGGYSAIGRRFSREQLTPDPHSLGPKGLSGCRLDAPRGQELFVRSVIPAGPMVGAALRSKALRRFISAVPSLHELGVFYHLLTLLRAKHSDGRPEHEIIVADMPATGQTLALTQLPEILLEVMPEGPVPATMREGQSYLNDPKQCAAWVVTLPELLPVTEALELIEGLEATQMTVGGVLLNRVPERRFDPEEYEALGEFLTDQPLHGELAYRRIAAAHEARRLLRAESALPVFELPERSGNSTSELHDELVARLATWMEGA